MILFYDNESIQKVVAQPDFGRRSANLFPDLTFFADRSSNKFSSFFL